MRDIPISNTLSHHTHSRVSLFLLKSFDRLRQTSPPSHQNKLIASANSPRSQIQPIEQTRIHKPSPT
ncbi:hypothetical protein V6N13_121310 [Hibiscus sabdariffa]